MYFPFGVTTLLYQFIDEHEQEFGIRWLLRRMGICPNAYYNYRKDRKAGYREQKEQFKNKILQINRSIMLQLYRFLPSSIKI